MRLSIPLRIVLATSVALAAPLAASEVSSPDGRIKAELDVDGDGVPFYRVWKDGEEVIAESDLGFTFTDAQPMRRNFAIENEQRASHDGTWEQPWGERRFVRDHHNELAVTFRETRGNSSRALTVRMRVFDDGVGFRYEFPQSDAMPVANIAEELTEFVVAGEGTAWWIPGGDWNRYEYRYNETRVGEVSIAHTPMTVRLDSGTHLAFHEAALIDYSGMWLRRMEGQRFRAQLAPSSRGAKVVRKGAFNTPWRTIRIGDPAALVESDIDLNLNEPNKLGDVSWVEPGKYIGIWWGMISNRWTWGSGERHGATTERAKQYIDFAAENGFRGILVEGWNVGWDGDWFNNGREFSFTQAYRDFDLEQVTDYAREKGVRLIGHHETSGNIANYEAQLDAALDLYQRLGVDWIKTGYVADAGGVVSCNADIADPCEAGTELYEWHDGQRQVQHHLKVVTEAAKRKISINPHEPVKDTGLRRTYPNWVSREGARGQEYNAWNAFGNGVEHDPTLVYTRMLAGPMDYTPGVLGLVGDNGHPFSSTLAKQLGLYLAIYSPIQMASDFIESLEAHPRELEFIRQVPADWSESRLIAGAVGDYAIFARKDRSSADWYVGGVNDGTERDLEIAFDMLKEGTAYTATIYKDGPTATYETEARHEIAYDTVTVRSGDRYPVRLAPGGGLAIRLSPAE